MAGRLDRHDPHARRSCSSWRPSSAGSRRSSWRSSRPGSTRPSRAADDRADPDHGPLAAVPGGRRRRHERAQLPRTVRRRGPRPARLQPGDHLRRHRARAAVRRPGPRLRAWCSVRSATSLVQVPSLAGIGARIRPCVDLRRRAGAPGAAPDGAARDRPGGHPDRVPGHDQPRDDARCRGRSSVFNFAFALLQIPIGVIGVPLGVVLLPSLSREAALGAGRGVPRLVRRPLRCSPT